MNSYQNLISMLSLKSFESVFQYMNFNHKCQKKITIYLHRLLMKLQKYQLQFQLIHVMRPK